MIIPHLTCQDDLNVGLKWLAQRNAMLAGAVEIAGEVPVRLRDGGFPALLNSIVSQQVSVASADAIWGRLEAAGLTHGPAVAIADEDALKGCGLSRQKMRYARALAESGIDFDDLGSMETDEVIAQLTSITGIGVWTAEIYAMFSLGRADVFPSGDLALQEAARLIFDLPERPKDRALREMAQDWSPWRTVAATLFWKYYAVSKDREGIRT